MHITGNVIQEIKKFSDNSFDLVFTDPPYNLGSEWIIKENGKPDTKGKAVDFMNNKWKGLTGEDLESMFIDFFRVLKHGGYVVFAGQMRQAMAFQYYAINAGLDMIEPIYSYSISSFPKSLDVSKSLDRFFGAERKVIKEMPAFGIGGKGCYNGHSEGATYKESLPSSDLAKKYNGIKSSIVPLKQTTEVWFIFRKPFKHGTITKDILAYEDGDTEIHPSGLHIDNGRVPANQGEYDVRHYTNEDCFQNTKPKESKFQVKEQPDGRYPSQLFLDGAISYTREEIDLDNKDFLEFIGIDSTVIHFMEKEKAIDYVCQHLDKFDVSKLLDEQSGVLTSGTLKGRYKGGKGKLCYGDYSDNLIEKDYSSNSGGCSRILHNASFVLTELYQHIYYSKTSRYERNAGCEYMEEKSFSHDGRNKHVENPYQRHNSKAVNNHPTLKSLKLLYNIITLFNTVDTEKMKVLIPFSGVFSEKIAFLAHGYLNENITTIEISEYYSAIGKAREKFWVENNFFFKDQKEVQPKIKESIEKKKNIKNSGQAELF